MRLAYRYYGYIFAAAALIALSFLIYQPASKAPLQTIAAKYDSYMSDAQAYSFDENGNLTWQATAKRWQHFPDSETTELKEPILSVYREDGSYWNMQSQHGTLWHHLFNKGMAELIHLDQQLKIYYYEQADSPTPMLTAKTQSLNFYPLQQWLKTEDDVEVFNGSQQLQAKGLRANLHSGIVDLQTHVKGYYQDAKK